MCIVMPAYNEAEIIKDTIEQWYPVIEKLQISHVDSKLIIANDGSKDDTLDIMLKLKDRYPHFLPIDKDNSGHGSTLLYLYRYVIHDGANYVFQTDSDGQTNPNDFWVLRNQRDKYDVQIGNRISRKDGFSRVVVSFVLRLVYFHEWLKDANFPFRLMNTNKLDVILRKMPADFFLSNVMIAVIAQKYGLKMAWHNITFNPRQGGVNSINLKKIILIGLKSIIDFRKIKA